MVAYLVFRGTSLPVTTRGLWLAAAAGLLVGVAELLTFVLFSTGVPASRGVPVLVGGSILVAALLGPSREGGRSLLTLLTRRVTS